MNVIKRIGEYREKRWYALLEFFVDIFVIWIYIYGTYVDLPTFIFVITFLLIMIDYILSFVGVEDKMNHAFKITSIANLLSGVTQFSPHYNLSFLRALRIINFFERIDITTYRTYMVHTHTTFYKHIATRFVEMGIIGVIILGFLYTVRTLLSTSGVSGGYIAPQFIEIFASMNQPQTLLFYNQEYLIPFFISLIGILLYIRTVVEILYDKSFKTHCHYCNILIRPIEVGDDCKHCGCKTKPIA